MTGRSRRDGAPPDAPTYTAEELDRMLLGRRGAAERAAAEATPVHRSRDGWVQAVTRGLAGITPTGEVLWLVRGGRR